jgi:GST-like protein
MANAKDLAKAKRGRRLNKPIDLYYWPTPNGLKISPNNRMPAIVDPNGPGGRSISVFESGAILQYLGRKTGKFYPADERARVAVDEWLFWQMANLGPKAGEANHFRRYAPERLPYALDRFGNEMNRLYGVMNTRLKDRRFLAGRYSIADMACVCWIRLFERQQEKEGGETFAGLPHLKRWLATVRARPAVQRGMHVRVEEASRVDLSDPEVRAVLFGQRAK